MNTTIIEFAPFSLASGRTEADLAAASDAFQKAFLNDLPGFLRRETLRLGDGRYADLVHWRSRAEADAAMEKAMTSQACAAFFSVMDMASQEPGAGVQHYESLKVYE
jgi:hypothetical protein